MDMVDRPVEAHEELAAAPADHRARRRHRLHDADIVGPGRRQSAQQGGRRQAGNCNGRDIMIVFPLSGLAVVHAAIGA